MDAVAEPGEVQPHRLDDGVDVRTAMVEAMEPPQVKYMTDKIPMKRCGTLEEVASLASWIVSPEASFNTGFAFDLTGGRAVY